MQLSAVCGTEEFDRYVVPRRPISKEASAVTKLCYSDGKLSYRGQVVPAIDVRTCLTEFLEFLNEFSKPVLVAHNGHNFDGPILCNELYQFNLLQSFQVHVCGIMDTLKLFRQLLPELSSHTQQSIASYILNEDYNAHNSLDDVKTLEKIMERSDTSLENKLQYCVSLSYIIDNLSYGNMKKAALDTLQPLLLFKIITSHMAGKIAGTGLSMNHLELAYMRNGSDGLEALLTECVDGKPRVTRNKKILAKIVSFFSWAIQLSILVKLCYLIVRA